MYKAGMQDMYLLMPLSFLFQQLKCSLHNLIRSKVHVSIDKLGTFDLGFKYSIKTKEACLEILSTRVLATLSQRCKYMLLDTQGKRG